LVASGNGFADSLVEGIENIPGLNNATEAVVNTNDNAAVEAVIDAVPGLDLRTVARQGAVSADERQLLAEVTRR